MNALTYAEVQSAAAMFDPAKVVDELGFIKAQIAELENKEKALKAALIAAGRTTYAGTFYDASVGSTVRETVDGKKLREDLGDEIMADYVKHTPVVSVRVVAKK